MFQSPTVAPQLPIKQRLARNQTPVQPTPTFKPAVRPLKPVKAGKKKPVARQSPLMQAILAKQAPQPA